MTKQEIFEIIKEAKELGLRSIEIDGIKVEFNDSNKNDQKRYLEPSEVTPEAKDLVAPPSPYDELTDEEILFWSSDYGPELERQRKKEYEDNVKRNSDDSIE